MPAKLDALITDSVVSYLGTWAEDSDGLFEDYRKFYERGFYALCASRIVGAGATEGDDSKTARKVERIASLLSLKTERRMIDDALKGCSVFVCPDCSHHAFVDFDEDSIDREDFETWSCGSCDQGPLKFDSSWD